MLYQFIMHAAVWMKQRLPGVTFELDSYNECQRDALFLTFIR